MPEPRRLKLTLSYNGTSFAGWQVQRNRRTIQGELERAAGEICGERVAVIGAGRTDAGVHALGQCAHLDLPRNKLPTDRWAAALNGCLPREIRVLRATNSPREFHARYSARAKTYQYRIIMADVMSPLENDRAWHLKRPLDLSAVTSASEVFLGQHDFAAFAANRGTPPEDTKRTITMARAVKRGHLLTLTFTGDGFLYKMVRLMVGAIVRCGQGRENAENVRQELREGRPRGQRLVAPASGLFLLRVRY